MTDPHPTDAIDVEKAIADMTRAMVEGGHWDERAVRVRPELAECLHDDRRFLLEALAEDDETIDVSDIDDLHGDLTGRHVDAVAEWARNRAAYCMGVLKGIEPVDGMIPAWRAVQCMPDDLRPKLGVHWSWDPTYGGGASVHWPPEGDRENLPEILMAAMIPVSSVDWDVTLLCAMDYMNGCDERELRLLEDADVHLVSMEVSAEPTMVPDRLKTGCTA